MVLKSDPPDDQSGGGRTDGQGTTDDGRDDPDREGDDDLLDSQAGGVPMRPDDDAETVRPERPAGADSGSGGTTPRGSAGESGGSGGEAQVLAGVDDIKAPSATRADVSAVTGNDVPGTDGTPTRGSVTDQDTTAPGGGDLAGTDRAAAPGTPIGLRGSASRTDLSGDGANADLQRRPDNPLQVRDPIDSPEDALVDPLPPALEARAETAGSAIAAADRQPLGEEPTIRVPGTDTTVDQALRQGSGAFQRVSNAGFDQILAPTTPLSGLDDEVDATLTQETGNAEEKVTEGVTEGVDLFAAAEDAKNVAEAGVFAAKNPSRADDVLENAVAVGRDSAEQAAEQPLRTGGTLLGGVVLGTSTSTAGRGVLRSAGDGIRRGRDSVSRAVAEAQVRSGDGIDVTRRADDRGQLNPPGGRRTDQDQDQDSDSQETITVTEEEFAAREDVDVTDDRRFSAFDRADPQRGVGRARTDPEERANPLADTAEERLPPREAFPSEDRFQQALQRRQEEIRQERQQIGRGDAETATDADSQTRTRTDSTEATVAAIASAGSRPGSNQTTTTADVLVDADNSADSDQRQDSTATVTASRQRARQRAGDGQTQITDTPTRTQDAIQSGDVGGGPTTGTTTPVDDDSRRSRDPPDLEFDPDGGDGGGNDPEFALDELQFVRNVPGGRRLLFDDGAGIDLGGGGDGDDPGVFDP